MRDSFNLIYVAISDKCNEEYIEETGKEKTKLRDRVRVYHKHIRQSQYQQLKVEKHLRVFVYLFIYSHSLKLINSTYYK